MADALQTYPVSIPSVALARMAGELADSRVPAGACSSVFCAGQLDPVARIDARDAEEFPASAEFYRIIDRISRGEKP